MKKGMRAVVLLIVTAALAGPAEAPAQIPGRAGGPASGVQRREAQTSGPAAGSASVRESGSSSGRIRLGAGRPDMVQLASGYSCQRLPTTHILRGGGQGRCTVVGMVFPDQEVRDSLIRFVREGGGLGGVHGTTYAALDWPEFTEMIGAGAGPHRVEKQMLKVDDPDSPLTKVFGGKGFEHTDEFYHFPATSPYSREKLHVLLSIDVEKSDMATSGRLCGSCTRPDHDYGMSWIRSYGKVRVFITPLGHTPILFTSPPMVQHMLAGLQFILGDLEADTTPSAKLAARNQQ